MMENVECAVSSRTIFGASATTLRLIEKEFRGKDRNLRYQKRLKIPMLHRGGVSKAFTVFSTFLELFEEIQRKGRKPAHPVSEKRQNGPTGYAYRILAAAFLKG